MIQYKSPLKWPAHTPSTPITKQRNDNNFLPTMVISEALGFLEDELKATGIEKATLYSEYEQINGERLRKRLSNRTGVCIYIKHLGHEYVISCDKWQKIEHNIYALSLTLRGWCNIENWGIASINTLISGFRADIKADIDKNYANDFSDVAACLKEFGLGNTATLDDATAIYHRRAKALPDDGEQLVQLNLAMDKIREYLSDINNN